MASRSKYWKQDGKVERTCIYFKNEIAGFDYYGLPSSVSSLLNQVLEYRGTRFNLDNVENNMVIGGAVFLSSSLSEAEATRIGNNIIKRHTGAGKQGRIAVIASEQSIADVKFVPFDTHKEGSYKEMDETCESKIIFANNWDSVLAGLQVPSSIGKGSGYLQEIYDQKYRTVIRPLINTLIEQMLNPLMEIADDWLGTKWTQETFDIQPIEINNKSSEAATTVKGIEVMLQIITLVASGAYKIEAAIKLVSARFGISEQEAKDQLGDIQNLGIDVLNKSPKKTGADNAG